jgi:hypothetical protein
MKIGRAADLRNVQSSDWKRVAAIVQLSWSAARIELQRFVSQVVAALPTATALCVATFGQAAVYGKVGALV